MKIAGSQLTGIPLIKGVKNFSALHSRIYTTVHVCDVVQFCPWFNFYFPLLMCMVMHDDAFKTKENKN